MESEAEYGYSSPIADTPQHAHRSFIVLFHHLTIGAQRPVSGVSMAASSYEPVSGLNMAACTKGWPSADILPGLSVRLNLSYTILLQSS